MIKVVFSLLFAGSLLASQDFIIVEGDIAVKNPKIKSSFLPSAGKWPGGVIPWTIDPADENNNSLKRALKGAMDILNKNTNLVFKKRTERDGNFLVFTSREAGCFSFVGMQGGPQELNLSKGCYNDMIVAHEILHAVGMEHEQSREDRDEYLTILWDNIKEDQKHNFNLIERSNFGEYNLNSIMHYGSYSFSKNGKPTMVTKKGEIFEQNIKYFTQGDQEAVNAFYPYKFKFDLNLVELSFEQQGSDKTFIKLKTEAEIIKSIESVSYGINDVEISEPITTWDNNFRYIFEHKKGKNVIHVTFNLKDGTKEEADYFYYYTGRTLEVHCRFVAKRDSMDFSVPITYEGDDEMWESKESRDYFAKAVAVFNPSTNNLELHMIVGREAGLIRREQKEEQTFTILENETHKVEVDRASLTCEAINEPL